MTIKFSKFLYTKKAIALAIEAYGELGKFLISESREDFVVAISDIDPDFKDVIKDEFCNYVLALMKK